MSQILCVGIDPGANTGFAVWNTAAQRFTVVASLSFPGAFSQLQVMHQHQSLKLVVFEDARQRSWFGTNGVGALQGAGSIKRDCSLWEEFMTFYGMPFRMVSPKQKGAKVDAARFEKMTRWTGRTNEHARDAAMLVFGL